MSSRIYARVYVRGKCIEVPGAHCTRCKHTVPEEHVHRGLCPACMDDLEAQPREQEGAEP